MSHEWAPVLYGRTRYADRWWRVLPPGQTEHGVLAGLVLATVGGGDALDLRPRFVLARGAFGVLVGVACPAASVSDTMAMQAGRPLYTFVGWLGPIGAQVPSYEVWEQHWREWARPAYDRLMSPDWDLPDHEVAGPRAAEPGPPVWEPDEEPALADDPLPPAESDAVWLFPESLAAAVWGSARGSGGPFCLTTGWTWGKRTRAGRITHLCSEDVPEQRLTRPESLLPPATPLRPETEPESKPVAGTGPDTSQPSCARRTLTAIKNRVWRGRKQRTTETAETMPEPPVSSFDLPFGPIVPESVDAPAPEPPHRARHDPAERPFESGREQFDEYFGTD